MLRQSAENYCVGHNLKFSFAHCPLAPRKGGIYERLIKTFRTAFTGSVGRKVLDYFEHLTVIVETESIMKNRPLTNVAENSTDIFRPLNLIALPTLTWCPSMETWEIEHKPGRSPNHEEHN